LGHAATAQPGVCPGFAQAMPFLTQLLLLFARQCLEPLMAVAQTLLHPLRQLPEALEQGEDALLARRRHSFPLGQALAGRVTLFGGHALPDLYALYQSVATFRIQGSPLLRQGLQQSLLRS
jgi:hypothetical protein